MSDQTIPNYPIFRRIPFASLAAQLGEPDGEAAFPREYYSDTFATLGWAASEHILEGTVLWDDDILPWHPDNSSGNHVLSRQDQLLLEEIKEQLRDSSVNISVFGCDLSRAFLFKAGALTAPDEEVRLMARHKIERALAIASALDAGALRLNLSREGFEEPLRVQWDNAFNALAEGLSFTAAQASQTANIGAIELYLGVHSPKRRSLFLPSLSSAAAFLQSRLSQYKRWKLCPESAATPHLPELALLATSGLLAFFPLGAPELKSGMEKLLASTQAATVLREVLWHGPVEFLEMPSRTEAPPDDRENFKRQTILHASMAFTTAISLASRLPENWSEGLADSEAGLIAAALCTKLEVDDILKITIGQQPEASQNTPEPPPEPAPEEPIPQTPAENKNETATGKTRLRQTKRRAGNETPKNTDQQSKTDANDDGTMPGNASGENPEAGQDAAPPKKTRSRTRSRKRHTTEQNPDQLELQLELPQSTVPVTQSATQTPPSDTQEQAPDNISLPEQPAEQTTIPEPAPAELPTPAAETPVTPPEVLPTSKEPPQETEELPTPDVNAPSADTPQPPTDIPQEPEQKETRKNALPKHRERDRQHRNRKRLVNRPRRH